MALTHESLPIAEKIKKKATIEGLIDRTIVASVGLRALSYSADCLGLKHLVLRVPTT